jgi:hypothetical protein
MRLCARIALEFSPFRGKTLTGSRLFWRKLSNCCKQRTCGTMSIASRPEAATLPSTHRPERPEPKVRLDRQMPSIVLDMKEFRGVWLEAQFFPRRCSGSSPPPSQQELPCLLLSSPSQASASSLGRSSRSLFSFLFCRDGGNMQRAAFFFY